MGEGGFEPPKPKQQIYSLPHLTALELSHIRFSLRLEKNWSWWTDSNPRPADYKSAALPAELHQHLTSEPYYNRGFPECQQESSPTERNFIALKLCNLTFKGRCDFLAPSGRGLAARSADWGRENCVLRLSLRRPAGDTSLAEGGKDGGTTIPPSRLRRDTSLYTREA